MKFFLIICLSLPLVLSAQQLVTRSAVIRFSSDTPLEAIRAENRQAIAALDASKKSIAVAVLVKGFLFAKALMQEHFNENYIESDKYPKATFSGVYTGALDLTKNGKYPLRVQGQLMLHGVSNAIDVPATIEVSANGAYATTTFDVRPEDYKISIPSLVREKIAKTIAISIEARFSIK